MTMEDIRRESLANRVNSNMTAVIVEGQKGKEYRSPTEEEIRCAAEAKNMLSDLFKGFPLGLPNEPTPSPAGSKRNSSSLRLYGLMQWQDLFNSRQLLTLGTFVKLSRNAYKIMLDLNYTVEWKEALIAYIAVSIDKLADYNSNLCIWNVPGETMNHVFTRFAFPVVWDYAELNPLSSSTGNYWACIEWVAAALEHVTKAYKYAEKPRVLLQSAMSKHSSNQIDLIVTDPPYYDAIMYSDLMDFFYVWLHRIFQNLCPEIDKAFCHPLNPKWNHDSDDGELIDDPGRHGWDLAKSQAVYENGMLRAFQSCYHALTSEGRLVIVFAHKQPDAWEKLVSAVIRSGFVVDASWPIMTERSGGVRNFNRASLASSVWLVCRKRLENARPGWDNIVLEEMQKNITENLRYFWDAGIRGPDFVWAATGPALEAYSKHPVVRKANEQGKTLSVTEFLGHVRRMVADFVVGRVLTQNGGTEMVSGLDDVTTYYLLHRYNFGLESTPIGPCILYAVSCNLSDSLLLGKCDLLVRTGGQSKDEDEEEVDDEEGKEEGTSSTVKLKPWSQRKYAGIESAGLTSPLIDKVHRLMHLWRAGDVLKVDEYLEMHGLGYNTLFGQLLQALIELAPAQSEERALLESISNHVAERSGVLTNRFSWTE